MFDVYDGMSCPMRHLDHYRDLMAEWSTHADWLCRIFPTTLGEVGSEWFKALPRGSVRHWDELICEFIMRFETNIANRTESDQLLRIRMEDGESMADYMKKFKAVYGKIKRCPDDIAISAFRQSMPPDHPARLKIAAVRPRRFKYVEEIAREQINREDELKIVPAMKKATPPAVITEGTGKSSGRGREGRRMAQVTAAPLPPLSMKFDKPIWVLLRDIIDR